jgi:hypothetical protein
MIRAHRLPALFMMLVGLAVAFATGCGPAAEAPPPDAVAESAPTFAIAVSKNDASGTIVELRGDGRVFLGDAPKVTAHIQATGPVFKKDSARGHRAVQVDVITGAGKVLPRLEPECKRAPIRDDDFEVIPAGKSLEYEAWPSARPTQGGNYTLHVQVRPFRDSQVVFEGELPVTYVAISKEMIADHVELLMPEHRTIYINSVELMNVKDQGRHHLLLRTDWESVQRVRDLDADSRLTAVLKFVEVTEPLQEIWVDYDLKGERRRLRVNQWGRILEDAKAGEGSPPELVVEEILHHYSRSW